MSETIDIPADCRYIGLAGVAQMLGYSVSHVKQRIVSRPDFPVPLREGHPRWNMAEVKAWADERR